jgi:hypothetical protein
MWSGCLCASGSFARRRSRARLAREISDAFNGESLAEFFAESIAGSGIRRILLLKGMSLAAILIKGLNQPG